MAHILIKKTINIMRHFIIIKRTFTWCKKSPITSEYMKSKKYVLFMHSNYYNTTWHTDDWLCKTYKEAINKAREFTTNSEFEETLNTKIF